MDREYKTGVLEKKDEVKEKYRTDSAYSGEEKTDPAAVALILFVLAGLAILIVKGVEWWVTRK